MQKRTREIIALGLLAIFAILAICGVSWYIFFGHRWNEAASIIDDRVGKMDGYTVVLFEGLLPEHEVRALVSSARISGAVATINEKDFWYTEVEPDELSANKGNEPSAGTGQEDAPESVVISGAVARIESGEVRIQAPLNIEEFTLNYDEKEAGVITLHVDEPERYLDPIIINRNGKRIGIVTASSHRPELSVRKAVKELKREDVDFVICVIDDFDAIHRGLGNVNVAICTDVESMGKEARYVGMTYVVGVPYQGQIGAVVVSPSGFLSSKTITSN